MTFRTGLLKSLHSILRRRSVGYNPSLVAIPLVLLLTAAPAVQAGELDEPTALAMAGDLLIARPAGVVITALGSVAFVASLPFSAAGGNINQAAEHLVLKPAKTTFIRCLGCTTSGYKHEARDEKK